jgi:predicted RNA-binding protein
MGVSKMCEAHAFLLKDGKEEKIMESVDQVQMDGDEVKLVNIFGEQKSLKARIRLYSNSEGKILFETL